MCSHEVGCMMIEWVDYVLKEGLCVPFKKIITPPYGTNNALLSGIDMAEGVPKSIPAIEYLVSPLKDPPIS